MILVVVLLLLVLLSVIRKFFTRMSVIHSYHYQVDKELFLAAEGMYTGQSVYCGKKAEIAVGAGCRVEDNKAQCLKVLLFAMSNTRLVIVVP